MEEYVAKGKMLRRSEDMSKRVRLWREAYREFSNEPMVLHNDNQSTNRTLQPAFGCILSPDYNDIYNVNRAGV